jgi:hypothetical protein
MTYCARILCLTLGASIAVVSTLPGQLSRPAEEKHSATPNADATYKLRSGALTINNIWLKFLNDGRTGYDTVLHKGLSYPKGYGNLLFSDALYWVGKVNDGQSPILRASGGRYTSGTVPGSVLSKGVAEVPQAPASRIYRFRPDYQTADLTNEASVLFGVDSSKVTAEMTAAVRSQYETDLTEWPWQKGAPFVDKNANGIMDAGELPGLQNADQLAWFAYNDLDATVSGSFS